MLQKSLYLTINIRFILFLQDVKFFKGMSNVRGRGERFPKFRQCQTKGGVCTFVLFFSPEIFNPNCPLFRFLFSLMFLLYNEESFSYSSLFSGYALLLTTMRIF